MHPNLLLSAGVLAAAQHHASTHGTSTTPNHLQPPAHSHQPTPSAKMSLNQALHTCPTLFHLFDMTKTKEEASTPTLSASQNQTHSLTPRTCGLYSNSHPNATIYEMEQTKTQLEQM